MVKPPSTRSVWPVTNPAPPEATPEHPVVVHSGETRVLAASAYAPLGDEGCARLRALVRPLSRAIVDGGRLAGLAVDDDEAP